MVLGFLLLPLWALVQQVLWREVTQVLGDTYTWRVVRFSFWQATLSTLISIALAILTACALSRRGPFWGRSWALRLFSVPLVMPTLVVIVGVVAVYGNRGWGRQLLDALGFSFDYNVYGLNGILLAHVFFNFPLATRVFLQALELLPASQWRVASQLGLGSFQQFRHLEWHAIRRVLRPVAGLIFCLCFTSFAVVLTLGGGPKATTLEVAIYQALRLDFDIATAVTLALLQLLISAAVVAILWREGTHRLDSSGLASPVVRPSVGRQLPLNVVLFLGMSFIVIPIVAVVARGLGGLSLDFFADARLHSAIINTLLAGFGAGLLSVLMALGLLYSSRHLHIRRGRTQLAQGLVGLGHALLLVPSVVLSVGLFLLLREYADVMSVGLGVVVIVNSLLALPFAISMLQAPIYACAERSDRLCTSLGLLGWQRWRWVEWPAIRRSLGSALGLSSAMAAGDLTAIALFGHRDLTTLPLLLYQRLGSYRLAEAAATALILLAVGLLMFQLAERITTRGQPRAQT